MAASKAERMSTSEQPFDQQTLYTAILALGTPPLDVPGSRPSRFAFVTMFPAAVDAVWVP